MTVPVPPPRDRFWFWVLGRRVDPLYRPWIAQQVNDPQFLRKRTPASLVVPLVAVVVPQSLLALAVHSRLRLIGSAVYLFIVAVAAAVSRNRPMPEASRRRLLAHHGVTADGRLVEPVSVWADNPLGKTGLVLLSAQVLVFASGIAVAADRITAQRACHRLPAADLAALQAVVGQPVVPAAAAAFGAPVPIVPAGTRLTAAREVDTWLHGMRYVAAYAPGPSGRVIGPAVWRILTPHSLLNPTADRAVDAQDRLARQITPTTGYGSSSPADPALDQAQDCAEAAR